MLPTELINLALQHEVEIEPSTVVPPFNLLTYSFRGCKPLSLTTVPLYIALHLRNFNFCTIRTPLYLSREFLASLIQKENSVDNFVEVPEYLFEHARIFMSDEIESLVADLRRIRMGKIWKGFRDMDGKALYISGLTKWEFNELKPVIVEAMKMGKRMEQSSRV